MKVDLLRVRGLVITIAHSLIVLVSMVIAFWIRFDFTPEVIFSSILQGGVAVALLVKGTVFLAGGLQRGWWRYAGLPDLVRIFVVNVIASAATVAVLFAIWGREFPRSVYAID